MNEPKQPYKPRSRRDSLSFMASLCVAADNYKAAEGYVMELLACLAFSEWDDSVMSTNISA